MKAIRHLLCLALVLGVLLHPLFSTALAATLGVLFSGSGGGAVISDPPGLACLANPCSYDFPDGTAVTLYAVPEAASIFTGWGGACGGTGTCGVTTTGAVTVTAGFDLAPTVQIDGLQPAYFATVQSALDAAPAQSHIQVTSGERTENVTLSRNIPVILSGGYSAGFTAGGETTTLRGVLTIGPGSMTIENIALASDTSPPTVVLTTPDNNAAGIPANVSCTAVFSKPVAAASVTASTFTLRKNGGSLVNAAVSIKDRVAVLTPVAPLVSGATYTATISTGVTDLAGNHLGEGTGWSFTIAPAIVTGPLAQTRMPANLVANNGMLFWSEEGEASILAIPASGGVPHPLAWNFGSSPPEAIALYGQDIYWRDLGGGKLLRTSMDGSQTVKLTDTSNGRGISPELLVDASGIYWVATTVSPDTYMIMSMPRGGGPVTTLYSSTTPIFGIAKDDTGIYWVEQFYPSPPALIRKMPLTGGTASTIYTSADKPLMRSIISITGNFLVFAEDGFPNSYRVLKLPSNGGQATELSSFTTNDPSVPKKVITRIVADDSHAYWLDGDSLRSAPLAVGATAILADGLAYPQDLAVDDRRIYWTETTGPAHKETGYLKSVPKEGGSSIVHFSGGDGPRRLLVNSAAIFWTDGGPIGSIEGFGRIATLPLAGGPARTLFQAAKGMLAADNDAIYVANGWRVLKIPRLGGAPEILATGDFDIVGIDTDGINVYWVEDPLVTVRKVPVNGGPVTTLYSTAGPLAGPAGPLRVVNGSVYWMSRYDTLFSMPTGACNVKVIATGLPYMSDFVTDGSFIYFAAQDSGALMKMPVEGGSPQPLALLSPFFDRHLATDGLNLYWIDQLYLGKVPINGGTPSYIAGGINGTADEPDSIALDGTSVYWTEKGNSLIRKATPK